MPDAKIPPGLETRGRRLWASLLAQDSDLEDETNPMREVALQACRTADRLDDLDRVLTGRAECWVTFEERFSGTEVLVKLDGALSEERQQSQAMARLISALRLPDEATGKKPQRRQLRGVQKPSSVAAVTPLERARAKSGA